VFHLAIGAAGRNRILTETYGRILAEGRRTLRLYYRSYGDTLPDDLIHAHDAQIEAIAARDEVRAERLGHEHAEEVRQRFLHFLGTRNTTDIASDYVGPT
jgi:DNA-binding GntR family transcriptional regulator